MGLREKSIVVASLSLFFSFRGTGACGVARQFLNNFVFPTCACAAGFNNNNK